MPTSAKPQKRRRGRPRKGEKRPPKAATKHVKPDPSTQVPDSSVRAQTLQAIDQEYSNITQLLHYNPWHSVGQYKSVSRGSYNPEVKVMHFYGLARRAKEKYRTALDYATTSFFNPDTKSSSNVKYNKLATFPAEISDCNMNEIDPDAFGKKVALNSSFDLAMNDRKLQHVNENDTFLNFPTDFTSRVGCAFNCGGLPLTSVWFDKHPASLGDDRFLLVSVLPTKHQKPCDIRSTDLEMLSYSEFPSFDSALLIYRVNRNSGEAVLSQSIVIDCGAIMEMKLLKSGNENSSLLACIFSNGTGAVIKLDESFLSGPKHAEMADFSIKFTMDDFKLLCCTWTSSKTILFGTTEGCIAEFDITKPKEPLYIRPLMSPSVIAMESDYGTGIYGSEAPPERSNNIFLSTGDMNLMLVDLSNPVQSVEGPKFRSPVTEIAYSSFINGYIYVDGTRNLKFSTVRDSCPAIKVKAYDQAPHSVFCSDYSPLILTGCANGAVRIFNFFEHFCQPMKGWTASTLRIYKVSTLKKGGNQFRLDLGYHLDQKEDLSNEYQAFDNCLNVTSCSMINNPQDNDIIGCCYASGLIVVEKLQSVHQKYRN